MCGIAAIFAYNDNAPPVDEAELLRIRERMITRGPDGAGLWLSDNRRVGLAHRRLSIIDLSDAGAQPMVDPDTGNVIVFNGEIYNYRELKAGLEAEGYRFRSNSDTEVLLKLYAKKGEAMLHDLRGMYAFAIYDPGTTSRLSDHRSPITDHASGSSDHRSLITDHAPSLFLARDPFGIKPLYYADDGKTIRVASQVKALLAGGQIDTTPEPAGHVGFFLWGHIPEPYTLYKGIRALPAGTWMRVSTDHRSPITDHAFCNVADAWRTPAPPIDAAEAQERLGSALRDTVRAHLVADVPVGVFLSSGLDSTTLAALVSETGTELHTVTLGFKEFRGTPDDEVPLAEEVARQYGAKHQTVWVTKEDFLAERERLLDAMDQPSIDGVNSYFVSMAAKRAGLKVALSGLGGDELLGGYPSFRQIPKSVRTFGWASQLPWLGKGVRKLLTPYASRLTSPKYASLLELGGTFPGAYLLRRSLHLPWELPQLLNEDFVREGMLQLKTLSNLDQATLAIKGDHGRVSSLETCWYMRHQLLRDADWASMAHSVEIRVPLVDLDLLRKVAPLIGALGQPAKQAMARTPKKMLPDNILNRPKSGFGVPTSEWLLTGRANKGAGSREWSRYVYESQVTSH